MEGVYARKEDGEINIQLNLTRVVPRTEVWRIE